MCLWNVDLVLLEATVKFVWWVGCVNSFLCPELEKHKYPSILDTEEHLQNWGTFMDESHCLLPAFDYMNYQEISSIKLISLILLIFSCSSDSLTNFSLFYSTLNILLLKENPQRSAISIYLMLIKCLLLRLPHNYLLDNSLIEAALLLLTWEFPHWSLFASAYWRICS